jgi:FkbM family methyltransferase
MLNLTRLHLGIAHESQFQGLGIIDPGRAALDIGVHIGIYARHFAKYAKCVIGFEANPNSAAFAKRSLSGLATIEWVALSSEAGSGLLRIPIEETNGTDLVAFGTISHINKLNGLRFREVVVPARALDDFNLPAVGFVKIDVKGHELRRHGTDGTRVIRRPQST